MGLQYLNPYVSSTSHLWEVLKFHHQNAIYQQPTNSKPLSSTKEEGWVTRKCIMSRCCSTVQVTWEVDQNDQLCKYYGVQLKSRKSCKYIILLKLDIAIRFYCSISIPYQFLWSLSAANSIPIWLYILLSSYNTWRNSGWRFHGHSLETTTAETFQEDNYSDSCLTWSDSPFCLGMRQFWLTNLRKWRSSRLSLLLNTK